MSRYLYLTYPDEPKPISKFKIVSIDADGLRKTIGTYDSLDEAKDHGYKLKGKMKPNEFQPGVQAYEITELAEGRVVDTRYFRSKCAIEDFYAAYPTDEKPNHWK